MTEIVRGWLGGGWTHEQMRDSVPCFETEALRVHAARYLKAREFFVATGEALSEWREGGMMFAVRPTLEETDLARIDHVVSGKGTVIGERERALLLDLAAPARSERASSAREAARLIEADLKTDAGRGGEANRAKGARGDREVFRPHDDDWAGRLAGLITLREAEALALAVSGSSRARFEAVREEVYVKRDLVELTYVVRAASGITHDVPPSASGGSEERAIERHLQAVSHGLRSRGEDWEEWQAAGVAEFKNILPASERARAGRVVEEARARLEAERRVETLERLEPQLDSAAQFYVRAAYRDEGLEVMCEPGHLRDHVRVLAERFAQVARDTGHEPESISLTGRELEVRARSALSDAVERFGREEREALELGRLEARMILACAVRDEAAIRRQRFADHAHFHEWNYDTLDGRGRTSLYGNLLSYSEETDRAALLVALDTGQHVARSMGEVQSRLGEVETLRAGEADAATRAYEARAGELSQLGVATRGPVFEPGDLARLEDAAVATRDHELIALVARCEEEMYGPEHAAARAMGRALRAAVVARAEHSVPERFEHPVEAGRLERQPEQVRMALSELLGRHRTAREAERSAARSFRVNLETQALERTGEAPHTPRQQQGGIRPLLTQFEASEVYAMLITMDTSERRSWEQKTKYAEVAGESDKSRGDTPQPLHEWARRNASLASRGSEYERGGGGSLVLSHSEARAIIWQQDKDLGRDRPTPSRGR